MDKQMTVQTLIDALQQVKDKRQLVGALVMGVAIDDTFITGVKPQTPNENVPPDPPGTIGVCWLTIPEKSSIHEE